MTASVVSLETIILAVGAKARAASRTLAHAPAEQRAQGLRNAATALRDTANDILAQNSEDVIEAEGRGTKGAFLDRLKLDPERLEAIARAVEDIAALPDPVGRVLASWTRPNGLKIERVATPLGVIGVIFESRPNVTADAAALCVKSGNAVILRCGSESHRTSTAIADAMRAGMRKADLPEDSIQLMPTRDREAVGMMLRGLNGTIDVIVPRGGKSLVARVQDEARVPVFAHLEGLCHVYVDGAADLAMARAIVKNAKLRRTGICGAAETLLVDRACMATHLAPLVKDLLDAGCEVRGDAETQKTDPRVKPAAEEDWSTEYLDAIIACRVVDGIDGALDHIARWSSNHTDCIVTGDQAKADRFLREVDSAIVLHNASTQFADGSEFGFGAEIGIATGRMHARGPVGVEQLTSFNYRVHGTGQVRA